MFLSWHIDSSRDLALALGNKFLDLLDELVDDITAALELDCVAIGLLLGELDEASALPGIVRTTSLVNQVPQVCT